MRRIYAWALAAALVLCGCSGQPGEESIPGSQPAPGSASQPAQEPSAPQPEPSGCQAVAYGALAYPEEYLMPVGTVSRAGTQEELAQCLELLHTLPVGQLQVVACGNMPNTWEGSYTMTQEETDELVALLLALDAVPYEEGAMGNPPTGGGWAAYLQAEGGDPVRISFNGEWLVFLLEGQQESWVFDIASVQQGESGYAVQHFLEQFVPV